ncbi:MAG: hypothetical protein ACJ72W_02305 [Actinoallomurus sp.]
MTEIYLRVNSAEHSVIADPRVSPHPAITPDKLVRRPPREEFP